MNGMVYLTLQKTSSYMKSLSVRSAFLTFSFYLFIYFYSDASSDASSELLEPYSALTEASQGTSLQNDEYLCSRVQEEGEGVN